jgi:pimeloyl-ACP methyl ester carboxylesterase
MPFLKLRDLSICYHSVGRGEALILIPGFASGAWAWFRQIENLAKDFQVITFDPRGIANSSLGDGETMVSIETIADDIAALLDELKIERANILGTSFGGFVAQEFALAYPDKLKKLILACTSFGGANHVAPAWEVQAAFVSTDDLNKQERIRKFIVPAFTPDFYHAHPDVVEQVCQLREQNYVPETVYMQQLESATAFDAEKRVSRIQAETLILTGDTDVVVPCENSRNLARTISNSKLEIIKGGSHMFFIEKAGEFNRIVTNFLEGKSV